MSSLRPSLPSSRSIFLCVSLAPAKNFVGRPAICCPTRSSLTHSLARTSCSFRSHLVPAGGAAFMTTQVPLVSLSCLRARDRATGASPPSDLWDKFLWELPVMAINGHRRRCRQGTISIAHVGHVPYRTRPHLTPAPVWAHCSCSLFSQRPTFLLPAASWSTSSHSSLPPSILIFCLFFIINLEAKWVGRWVGREGGGGPDQ